MLIFSINEDKNRKFEAVKFTRPHSWSMSQIITAYLNVNAGL